MSVRYAPILLLLAACRVGVAPGVTHRAHDGEVVSSSQFEVGGYLPQTGVGGFMSLTKATPVGETEGHSGWIWFLFEARYRRLLHRWQTSHAYWSAGAGFGDGSRGPVGGSHGEIGIEVPAGRMSFDLSLRHRLLLIGDGELTRPMNSLQLAFTIGWGGDR